LQTRSLSDPTIALLDAWSVVGDVLTFYNERYTQESYVRTAGETRSLQELSKLIGYKPGPGVASSTYLAFTLEKGPGQESQETIIPKGTQVQSVPGAGESAQTFETSEDLVARPEWSAIRPRQTRPQDINPENIEQIESIVVDGITPRMVANDLVVFDFGARSRKHLRYVDHAIPNSDYLSTTIYFVPTSFSALELIRGVKSSHKGLVEKLSQAPSIVKFPKGVITAVSRVVDGLRPEQGLVVLDKFLETKKADWEKQSESIRSVRETLNGPVEALDESSFVAAARTRLQLLISEFKSDSTVIDAAVTELRNGWHGGGEITGISTAITETEFDNAKTSLLSKIALVTAGSAVLQTTKTSLQAAITSIVTTLSAARTAEDVRQDFISAWATFSDLSTSIFESRKNVSGTIFEFDTFEKLARTQIDNLQTSLSDVSLDLEQVVNLLKKALLDKAWLSELGGDSPLSIKLRIGASTSFGPVEAKGLNSRLKVLALACLELEGKVNAFVKDTTETVDQLLASDQNSEDMIDDLKMLKQSLKDVMTATNFGKALALAAEHARTIVSVAETTHTELHQFVNENSKALDFIRREFKSDIAKAVSEFGIPSTWNPVGDEKAKKAKELLDQLNSFVVSQPTLFNMTQHPEDNHDLLFVIKELNKPEVKPTLGTIYAIRHSAVVNALERLLDSVGVFSFDSPVEIPGQFPDAAGLSKAISLLERSKNTAESALGRQLADILKAANPSSENETVVPDLYRQLAGSLSPQSKVELVAAWRQVRSSRRNPRVFAFKTIVPLFGFNSGMKNKLVKIGGEDGTLEVQPEEYKWSDLGSGFNDWRGGKDVYLSQPVEGVTVGSTVVFRNSRGIDRFCTVAQVTSPVQPGVLNIAAAGSYLKLGDEEKWYEEELVEEKSEITLLKRTSALLSSHEFTLVEVPISEPVGLSESPSSNPEIELDGLYPDLEAGRTLIVAGERFELKGVVSQDIVQVKYVSHRLTNRVKDAVHTYVQISTPLRSQYARNGVCVYANVTGASHGESTTQILGNGDASKVFQTMPLPKGPLTYLSAPNETGVQSTLEVRVNNIQWHEQNSLLESAPNGRDYVVQANPEGLESIQFGDGITGARLPTGNSNVVATYRTGLGKAGNVRAKTITNLASRPLGVKEVTNPLPATGGADPETIEQIRSNAPIAVMALDRLVSVRDYADFARNFAGIDKSVAQSMRLGGQPSIGITIAGAGDVPIAPDSELQKNLIEAYRRLGDPLQRVQIKQRELLLLFLSANVRLKSDYRFSSVEPMIRNALYDRFSFVRRELGQSLYLSEVYSAIQNVDGVAYVDVDIFATLSQSKFDEALKNPGSDSTAGSNATNGTNEGNSGSISLPSLFAGISTPKPQPDKHIGAHSGKIKNGEFAPAQLIYLSPDVPDSLFLTEVQ
jgi:hypothetical protein